MPRLVLKRPHTHAGKAFQAGDHIDVDATAADWLIDQGVAVLLTVREASRADAPITIEPEPQPRHRKEPKP